LELPPHFILSNPKYYTGLSKKLKVKSKTVSGHEGRGCPAFFKNHL